MIQINKLIEGNNLKSAISVFENYKSNFESLKKHAKMSLLIKRFEENFQNDINQQSLDMFLKNIKKVFEFMPKFSSTLYFNLKNNSQIEKIQNAAMIDLFSETVSLLKSTGNYERLKTVFTDRFTEYLENGILKNIDAHNLPEKTVDLFCFFVTYNGFRTQLFNSEIAEISLAKTEPQFNNKNKVNLLGENNDWKRDWS